MNTEREAAIRTSLRLCGDCGRRHRRGVCAELPTTERGAPRALAPHTPGPWGLLEHKEGGLMLFPVDGSCAWFTILPDDDANDIANAHLMAGAPDLLKALERLTAAYESAMADSGDRPGKPWRPDAVAKRARKAIKNARGA